jgi:hypothetical protein
MLTVNLEKALLKENDNKFQKEESSINELLAVIKNEEAEDTALMSEIFPAKQIQGIKLQNSKDKLEEIAQLRKKFSNKLFTEKQIKNVCCKYGLRFLHSSLYKGNIDPYAIILAKKFQEDDDNWNIRSKEVFIGRNDDGSGKYKVEYVRDSFRFETNASTGKWDKGNSWRGPNKIMNKGINYYICAPKKSFNLQTVPKDPLMFVYLGNFNGEDLYYLIHKWGKDLNIFRYIGNFFNRRISKGLLLLSIGITGAVLTILGNIKYYNGNPGIENHLSTFDWYSIFILHPVFWLGALWGLLSLLGLTTTNEDNWNNPLKDE